MRLTTPVFAAIFLIFATGALCILGPVTAQAQSQSALNQQADRDFRVADAGLNRVYRRLNRRLDPASQAKLKTAERAWIRFRDAQADFQADRVVRGGSLAPMIYSGVRAELTRTHLRELEQIWKDEK